jgi:alpha-glucosidase (family GH31 glycosyl hydrolase)
MEELGLLVGNEQGISVQLPMWDRDSTGRTLMTFYDSTNPQAQAYIWAKVRENYFKHGIRTWWLDACEPELRPEQPENGNISDPSFRELIVRWFQFGVFCPVFRLHGIREPGTMIGSEQTGAANEVWSFGDEQYGLIRQLLFLRERLRPYVMTQMRKASESGLPPMRPLFVDFPADPASWDAEDQFLFGADILVAPVYTPKASAHAGSTCPRARRAPAGGTHGPAPSTRVARGLPPPPCWTPSPCTCGTAEPSSRSARWAGSGG